MLAASVMVGTGMASAQSGVGLGTTGSFGALGATTVTNTGPTTITGDLGLSPGTDVADAGAITLHGSSHVTDALAAQAQSDLTTAYNVAAGRAFDAMTPADIGGQELSPGVYRASSSLGLTGDVTLNGGNDPNAVFIFQIPSALITATSSRVMLTGGTQSCNVFWQVGSSATLETGSTFRGTIMALTSIGLKTGAVLHGRALAQNGAVTMDTSVISNDACAAPTPSPSATTGGGGTPTPVALPGSSSGTTPAGTPGTPGTTGTTPPGTTPPGTTPPGTPGTTPSGGKITTIVMTRTPGTPALPPTGATWWTLPAIVVGLLLLVGGFALQFPGVTAARRRS